MGWCQGHIECAALPQLRTYCMWHLRSRLFRRLFIRGFPDGPIMSFTTARRRGDPQWLDLV